MFVGCAQDSEKEENHQQDAPGLSPAPSKSLGEHYTAQVFEKSPKVDNEIS